MIRGEISLQAETTEELQATLRAIANALGGTCNLDSPEGEERFEWIGASIIIAHFKVLPEYREGDLEKFIGCAPDFTGDMTTEEYIDKIRNRG